ncbi:MAG TPA: tetratricopeptide repeat protein [Flavobacteriaceae bacterium]|nr:tetratricopeptide repeat protein [Flavobacteriaceae bacterium]
MLQKHPYNTAYLSLLINSYQNTNSFLKTEDLIKTQLKKYPNRPFLWVELGYNLQLQHKTTEANDYYKKALTAIKTNPNAGYLVGKTFQENHLLTYALQAYLEASKLNPNTNYNYQIASIYGEQGEFENMFSTYLEMINSNVEYVNTVKTLIGRYITEDPANEYNLILKKLLLKQLRNNPNTSWNHLLSWLFLQEKNYYKAFIQEKALHKRNEVGLDNIFEIGVLALDNTDFNTASICFNYGLENNPTLDEALLAKLYLLQIAMETSTDLNAIDTQFNSLFNQYGKGLTTLSVQLVYANFLTYKYNNSNKAIALLKETLQLPINKFQEGGIKITLADIYVFQNKFNTALIYYSQVQTNLKNHPIAQKARFKTAQTSYFKGDFEWAQSQLKVLKKSTSQLIANDALALHLLITDNTVKDSTKTALKIYAKAELKEFQKKEKEAIELLTQVIETYPNHSILDEALYKQAKLFERTKHYNNAAQNYLQIIQNFNFDILIDDAIYYLAELYANQLNDPEKAKTYYQKIVFNHPSSIYLVEARKKFRALRGDILN